MIGLDGIKIQIQEPACLSFTKLHPREIAEHQARKIRAHAGQRSKACKQMAAARICEAGA